MDEKVKEIKERWDDEDLFGQAARKDINYLINIIEKQQEKMQKLIQETHDLGYELIQQNEQLKNRIPRSIEDDLRRNLEQYKKALSIIANEEYPSIQTNHSAKLFLVKVAKEALEY